MSMCADLQQSLRESKITFKYIYRCRWFHVCTQMARILRSIKGSWWGAAHKLVENVCIFENLQFFNPESQVFIAVLRKSSLKTFCERKTFLAVSFQLWQQFSNQFIPKVLFCPRFSSLNDYERHPMLSLTQELTWF